jgi:signal transduction histidine kinase
LNHSPKLDRPEKEFGLINLVLERFHPFLSHATRNPLQSIWGALLLIQRRVDPRDETLAQAVRIIREEIDQLHELVQETQEFVRPNRGNGLGAAIGNRIIVEHCQGEIKAERVAEEGLRLSVSLPIKRSPQP